MIAFVEASDCGAELIELGEARTPADVLQHTARVEALRRNTRDVTCERMPPAELGDRFALGWHVGEVKILIFADQSKFGGEPIAAEDWKWEGADAAEFGPAEPLAQAIALRDEVANSPHVQGVLRRAARRWGVLDAGKWRNR